MTPRRKLRTTPQWDVPVCPDPDYCATLPNPMERTCEELSKARTESALYDQLSGTHKSRFHAASNPYLSAELRRVAVGLEDKQVYEGLLLNPNLTRADLGNPYYWAARRHFLRTFLKRHDLIPASSLVELAAIKNAGAFGTWATMMEQRNLPAAAYDLLLEDAGEHLKLRVAQHKDAPASFLQKCLEYPIEDFHGHMWGDEKHPAIYHNNLPVSALLTSASLDELMEAQLLARAEERSEEVAEWLSEHHPELTGVPIEWVRLVLTGVVDD